jgi:RNA polymerase subunit RPABC4/transcription elongation factor Spt4
MHGVLNADPLLYIESFELHKNLWSLCTFSALSWQLLVRHTLLCKDKYNFLFNFSLVTFDMEQFVDEVNCKNCSHPVFRQQKYCSECGSKVQSSWFAVSLPCELDLCQGFLEDGSACGQPLEIGAKFCANCGNKSTCSFGSLFLGCFLLNFLLQICLHVIAIMHSAVNINHRISTMTA